MEWWRQQSATTRALVAGGAVGATLFGLYRLTRGGRERQQADAVPSFGADVRVAGLYVYPIKSVHGVAVRSLDAVEGGLKWDREWFLRKDADGKHLSMAQCPRLASVHCRIDDAKGCLVVTSVSAGGPKEPLTVPLAPAAAEVESGREQSSGTIFGAATKGYDEGDAAAAWLLAATGVPVRLLRTAKDTATKEFARCATQSKSSGYLAKPTDVLRAQSSAQVNVASLASMRALERDVAAAGSDAAVTWETFRPNVVIDGPELAPWAEDRFLAFELGALPFRHLRLTARCPLVTVRRGADGRGVGDGEYRTDSEPLATLARTRALHHYHATGPFDGVAGQPMFGADCFFDMPAGRAAISLSVGDAVRVTEWRPRWPVRQC